MANVLFVGHDAYRAGAQIELLHIIRWTLANSGHRASLFLRRGGDILDDYRSVVNTVVWERPIVKRPRFTRRAADLIRDRLNGTPPPTDPVTELLENQRFDLVYVNAVSALDLLSVVANAAAAPVVCHVHELEASIRRYCGLATFDRASKNVAGFIAASGAVERNLVENHDLPQDRVHRIYEAVYTDKLARRNDAGAREVRASLGIPDDAFVVGGCGTMDWRKAPDVFLQVARSTLSGANRPFHFLWVGGVLGSLEHEQLLQDAERLGIAAVTHFVGPKKDPVPYFSAFDVFFLSSREDPFPLVCLEAGALGLPILCFEESGGMPELVEDDAGFVLPYLDVEAVARALRELSTSPERKKALGDRAASKIRERYDIGVTGSKVLDVIARYAKPQEREMP